VDLVLHVEESFICKWPWFDPKPGHEVVKYQKEDSSQFLKNENNRIQVHQTDSWLQKFKRYFIELRKDDSLSDDTQSLVRW